MSECTCTEDPRDFACDACLEAMAEESEPKCQHKNSTIKHIMDFSFHVCNDCGHQWKVK